MRKRHFLSAAVTVGLVLSLFVAAFASASADVSPGTTAGVSALYFPWVHNGDSPGGVGPFEGVVSVQNLENYPITIQLTTASGKNTSANLNPHASKVFSAAFLGVKDGGEGVKVNAQWQSLSNAPCLAVFVDTIFQGNNLAITVPAPAGVVGGVSSIYTLDAVGGNTVAKVGSSTYSVSDLGTSAATVTFNGSDMAKGTPIRIFYNYCNRAPYIGGVEKHMAPSLTTGGAKTTSANTIVDGYSALSDFDLPAKDTSTNGSIYQSFLAIAQTNNGWNSVIHVTNFGANNAGVTLTFYQAFGQGAAGGSFGSFTQTMSSGQTWTFDLKKNGFPDGWVGNVFISSDTQQVVTAVDRVKDSTDMALTNVGAPRWQGSVQGQFQEYAPLIFRDFNNWNTGINIANLTDGDNTISITYYNAVGDVVGQDQITIPRRGMEYVYRPGAGNTSGSDADILRNHISSAVIQGTDLFHAAVDEVKYGGDFNQGQAMSYISTAQGANAGALLSLPLFEKGNMDGMGDTSGINLFNPDANNGVSGNLFFFDNSGAPVAPTLTVGLPINLSAHESYIAYSLSSGGDTGNFSEMPNGFEGSAVIAVTGGAGQLVGVSNNVNYAVQHDGSAVFNMYSTCGNWNGWMPCMAAVPAADHIVLAPTNGTTHTVGDNADLTATVYDVNNDVMINTWVTFTVSGANPTSVTVKTNNVGQAFFSYQGTVAGTDQVVASVGGVNSNTVTETWNPGAVAKITLAPANQSVQVITSAGVVATVTDQYGNPVPGATVDFTTNCANVSYLSDQHPTTDANGQAPFTFTSNTAQTCTVTATSNGMSATATVTFTHGAPSSTTSTMTCVAGAAGSGAETCKVVVKDAYGNPINDITVSYQVTSGTGTVTSNSQSATDAATTGVTVHGTSGTSVTLTAFQDANGNNTFEAPDILIAQSTNTLP